MNGAVVVSVLALCVAIVITGYFLVLSVPSERYDTAFFLHVAIVAACAIAMIGVSSVGGGVHKTHHRRR